MFSSASGVSDYFAENEMESFEMLRDLVGTLNLSDAPPQKLSEPPLYSEEELDGIVFFLL